MRAIACFDSSQKNIMEYTKVAKEEENRLRQEHRTFVTTSLLPSV